MRKYFRKFRPREQFCRKWGRPQILGIYGITKDDKVISEISNPDTQAMFLCRFRDGQGASHYCLMDDRYWVPLTADKNMEWGTGFEFRYKPDPDPKRFLSVVEKGWVEEAVDIERAAP